MDIKYLINWTIITITVLLILVVSSFIQSLDTEGLIFYLFTTILTISALVYHASYLIKNKKALSDVTTAQENQHLFPSKIYLSFIVYFLMFLDILMNIALLINNPDYFTFFDTLFVIPKTIFVLLIIWLSYELMNQKNFKNSITKTSAFDFILFVTLLIISLVCVPVLESFHLSIRFSTQLFIHLAIVYFPLILVEWNRYRNISYVLTLTMVGLLILPLFYSLIRSASNSTNFTLITFPLFATLLTVSIIYFFVIIQKKKTNS